MTFESGHVKQLETGLLDYECVDFLTTPLGHLPEPQSEGSNNSSLATKTAEMESPAISTLIGFTQKSFSNKSAV